MSDPANPPILTYDSIPELTGGRLTAEAALEILNSFFPGPGVDQFIFLDETGAASINSGRPLTFMFQPPVIDAINTIRRPVKTPYTDSFNVGVEQAVGAQFSIDAELFIRRSRDLLARRVINLLDAPRSANCNGNTTDGGPCIAQLQYIGFLDTNAFVLALKKRFSDRYSFLLSYTFTDATDNFSTLRVPPTAGEQSFLRNNDPSLDVGRSLNTPEHVLVFSGLYQLPYGFDVSGVLNFASGRPFNAAGLPLDSDGDGQFDNRLLGTEKRLSPSGSPSQLMVAVEEDGAIEIQGERLLVGRRYSGQYAQATIFTHRRQVRVQVNHRIVKVFALPIPERVLAPLQPLGRGRL